MRNFLTGIFIIAFATVFTLTLRADESSDSARIDDLARRVQTLEQGVLKLQQQPTQNTKEYRDVKQNRAQWTCKMIGRKDVYYGTGYTRGMAEMNATEKCRRESIDGFCKAAECSDQ